MSIAKPTEEELRGLYFLFQQNTRPVPRFPVVLPIELSESELEELIAPLRPKARHGHTNEIWFRTQLAAAGKGFPAALYQQNRPAISETERRFKRIQSAANNLLESLGVTGKSSRGLSDEIETWMQVAAEMYGAKVGTPSDVEPTAIPFGFWTAYKVPSVIVGIGLLEHWSGIAQEELRVFIKPRRSVKRTNAGDTAIRVLIHCLAGFWWQWHGNVPWGGYNVSKGTADGPFIRFAEKYLQLMRKNISQEHRKVFSGNKLDSALTLSKNSIASHLRGFKARIDKNATHSVDKVNQRRVGNNFVRPGNRVRQHSVGHGFG